MAPEVTIDGVIFHGTPSFGSPGVISTRARIYFSGYRVTWT
jgi:hypothetical protein